MNKKILVFTYFLCLILVLLGCSSDEQLGKERFKIITASEGEGSITIIPKKEFYEAGDQVELEAIPQKGWVFNGWSGDIEGNRNPKVLKITKDMRIIAQFVEDKDRAMINKRMDTFGEGLKNNKEEDLLASFTDNIESNIFGNASKNEVVNILLSQGDYIDAQIEDRIISIEGDLATVKGSFYQKIIYSDYGYSGVDWNYYPLIDAMKNGNIDKLSSILKDGIIINWWEQGQKRDYTKDQFIQFIVSSDYWGNNNYWDFEYRNNSAITDGDIIKELDSYGYFKVALAAHGKSKNFNILKRMSKGQLGSAAIDQVTIYVSDNYTYVGEDDIVEYPVELGLVKEVHSWKINKFNHRMDAYDELEQMLASIDNAITNKDLNLLKNLIPLDQVKWTNNGQSIVCNKEEFIKNLQSTYLWNYSFSGDTGSGGLDSSNNLYYSELTFSLPDSLNYFRISVIVRFSLKEGGEIPVLESIEFINEELNL